MSMLKTESLFTFRSLCQWVSKSSVHSQNPFVQTMWRALQPLAS